MRPAAIPRLVLGVAWPRLCPVCLAETPDGPDGRCSLCREALPGLAAPHCPGCGGTLDTALARCQECLRHPRPWALAASAHPYSGLARDIVHRLKYRGETTLVPGLAGDLLAAWRERLQGRPYHLVVPVPLHWYKLWRRGYNQVAIVGERFCRDADLPFADILRRRRWTRTQTRLSRHQRLLNLRRAFALPHPQRVDGRDVLLLDDVFTTGSTLTAAARVLLAAHPARLDVLTLARGILGRPGW